MISPKKRYFASIFSAAAFLVVVGGSCHYVANRSQRVALVTRLEDMERDLSLLRDDLASMQKSGAVARLSAEGNEPQRGESAEGSRLTSASRPRVLGRGRTGQWLYCDIRYPDGATRRYYIRANPSPGQVKQFVATLSADSFEHSIAEN